MKKYKFYEGLFYKFDSKRIMWCITDRISDNTSYLGYYNALTFSLHKAFEHFNNILTKDSALPFYNTTNKYK